MGWYRMPVTLFCYPLLGLF